MFGCRPAYVGLHDSLRERLEPLESRQVLFELHKLNLTSRIFESNQGQLSLVFLFFESTTEFVAQNKDTVAPARSAKSASRCTASSASRDTRPEELPGDAQSRRMSNAAPAKNEGAGSFFVLLTSHFDISLQQVLKQGSAPGFSDDPARKHSDSYTSSLPWSTSHESFLTFLVRNSTCYAKLERSLPFLAFLLHVSTNRFLSILFSLLLYLLARLLYEHSTLIRGKPQLRSNLGFV